MFINLRAELVRKNMTIKDLAQKVDIKYSTLTRKFSGAKDFTYSEILKITKFFNMTFEYLFKQD